MKAIVYNEFQGQPSVKDVPVPNIPANGVLIEVKATGMCRSDWHGWMGHDPDIVLPHVPGHEYAGVISQLGEGVTDWKKGDRVTAPFVCGCGACEQCASGNQQVCDHQTQAGFTHWGSFAEYVAVYPANGNLVSIPDNLSFEAAASLGCRFITAFRAILDQGNLQKNEWVAIHGCGGVGLSAIMIASALGANIIAIDINNAQLELAKALGATHVLNSREVDVVAGVKQLSGGVHVSVDALGSQETCFHSIACLRKRGRHVQVGLFSTAESHPNIPMDKVLANELEIKGSHGMQAHRYPLMLEFIDEHNLDLSRLLGKTISLDEAAVLLPQMNEFQSTGATVITF